MEAAIVIKAVVAQEWTPVTAQRRGPKKHQRVCFNFNARTVSGHMVTLRQQMAAHLIAEFPADAADVLREIAPEACAELFDRADPAALGALLLAFAPHEGTGHFRRLPRERQLAALEAFPADEAALLVRRLDDPEQQELLEQLSPNVRRLLTPLVNPGSATAGALAEREAVALFADLSIRDALQQHRDALISALHDIPVIDRDHRLVGTLAPAALLSGRADDTVRSLSSAPAAVLTRRAGLREVIASPGWVKAHCLPVVDEDGRLVGVLRYETLRWIEGQLAHARASPPPSTSRALGEVFATGVAGMLEAVASARRETDER